MRDSTRLYAYLLLGHILHRRHSLEEALDLLPPGAPRDRAAAHRLAAAVLRRLGSLDAVIEPFLRRAPPDEVRQILRIGAAGLLLLDTPAHAAVATAVDLARSQRLDPFAGLVNAVLRRIAAQGTALLAELDGPRLDTPPWLWSAYGAQARAIAEAEILPPPIDLSFKPGASVPLEGRVLPSGSVRFAPGTRITELAGFAAGDFWVQDAAAALPARLLAPRPHEAVADLCAAPGGKTAQLATLGAAVVVAVERSPERAARLRQNLDRLGLSPELVVADALDWQPARRFDAILLDAPCSATGTVRRHPEIKHLKRARDVTGLAVEQDRLIAAASRLLRPGGRLIYAVCSMLPEEGRARITAAEAAGLRLDPFTNEELGFLPPARTPDGMMLTSPALWPELGGMDGFFAARLIKP